MAQDENSDILRILVSTDNHLGVWEKDEVRKDDSFNSFEEVLQLAQQHNVDLLLLGGDLFHDNKPSRSTVIRAIELLHKYCLGDRPVAFQVLSDQQQNFVSGAVNFASPHINIGLPVFSIHGNHDDPAGQDNLSAVDLLSSCGLVNYFGKQLLSGSNIGRLTLSPVLLAKGATKLALYGLGNVRDERLGRLFSTPGCVQWLRPSGLEGQAADEWLNLFVLHQNRVQHGPTAKNCLQERHLPPFLDLVIWGHEHECRVDPEDLRNPQEGFEAGTGTAVVQPGSSVATALSEGEAVRKHVALLEVKGTNWRIIKLALDSVRPFVWGSISLRDAATQDAGFDPEDEAALMAFLEKQVTSMIAQARAERSSPAEVLPLIRLRVDYTGFSTINSQRFGQRFVGKVANPHDILLWSKAAARKAKEAGGGGGGAAGGGGGLGLTEGLRPEQLDQVQIEDLVAQHLGDRLELLPQDDLAIALHDFVDKDEKNALAECVTAALQGTQAAVAADQSVLNDVDEPLKEEDIAQVVNLCVQTRHATRVPGTSSAAGGADSNHNLPQQDSNHQPSNGLATTTTTAAAAAAAGSMLPPAPRPAVSGMRQAGLKELFGPTSSRAGGLPLSASSPVDSTSSGGGRGARGGARGSRGGRGASRGASHSSSAASKRKRKKVVSDDDEEEDEEAALAAEMEEGISDEEEEVVVAPASKRQRGAARSTRSQRTTGSRTAAVSAAGGDADDLSDLSGDFSHPKAAAAAAGRQPKRAASATPKQQQRQRHLQSEAISEDSEPLSEPIESPDDHQQPSALGGRGQPGGRLGAGGGGGGRRGSQPVAGAVGANGGASQHTAAAGGVTQPLSIVISDDEDEAPPPRVQPAAAARGGRRRIPSSFTGSIPSTSQR